MEADFPFEFVVHGTPVSFQRSNPAAKAAWKQLVRESAQDLLPEGHWTTERLLSATLYYFPPGKMVGDLDNVVKLTLDALVRYLFTDDEQIERVLIQKFEAGRPFVFERPSPTLSACIAGTRPAMYIRLQDDHEREPVR